MFKKVLTIILLTSLTTCYINPFPILEDVEGFMFGYFEGIQIFKNYQLKDCLIIEHTVKEDFIQIIRLIQDLDPESNIDYTKKEILNFISEIHSSLTDSVPKCLTLKTDLIKIINKIKQHLGEKEFLKNMAIHTVLQLGKLEEIIKTAIDYAKSLDWEYAGRSFGELTHFILFWDMNI